MSIYSKILSFSIVVATFAHAQLPAAEHSILDAEHFPFLATELFPFDVSRNFDAVRSRKVAPPPPKNRSVPSGIKHFADDQMRLNIGAGPAFTYIPGLLRDHQWVYLGASLDAYLVVPPAMLQQGKKGTPGQFQKYIDATGEMELRPVYLALIPSHVFLNPPIDGVSLVGATWHMSGLYVEERPIPEFSWKLGARLPAVTLMRIGAEDDILVRSEWFLGFGASGHARAIFHYSERLNMSLEWTQTFYLPMDDTRIQPVDDDVEKIWTTGTFSVLWNYRFGFMR